GATSDRGAVGPHRNPRSLLLLRGPVRGVSLGKGVQECLYGFLGILLRLGVCPCRVGVEASQEGAHAREADMCVGGAGDWRAGSEQVSHVLAWVLTSDA